MQEGLNGTGMGWVIRFRSTLRSYSWATKTRGNKFPKTAMKNSNVVTSLDYGSTRRRRRRRGDSNRVQVQVEKRVRFHHIIDGKYFIPWRVRSLV